MTTDLAKETDSDRRPEDNETEETRTSNGGIKRKKVCEASYSGCVTTTQHAVR